MQLQAENFHLNGHIIRFRPQTQKLELQNSIKYSGSESQIHVPIYSNIENKTGRYILRLQFTCTKHV